LGTCWWCQCLESYNWSAWNFVFTEWVSWAAKAGWSVKSSSLLKLLGYKLIYAVSSTVQSMQLTVYLVCMYCWSSVLKPWHDDYDIEHLQDPEVLKCLILKLKALWFFEILVNVNSQHSKYSRWLEESATLL